LHKEAPGQALKGPLWAFDSCTETLGSQISVIEFKQWQAWWLLLACFFVLFNVVMGDGTQ